MAPARGANAGKKLASHGSSDGSAGASEAPSDVENGRTVVATCRASAASIFLPARERKCACFERRPVFLLEKTTVLAAPCGAHCRPPGHSQTRLS